MKPLDSLIFFLPKGEEFSALVREKNPVASFTARAAEDGSETICPQFTFKNAQKVFITLGDAIYSNKGRRLLRITKDTSGTHDFLLPAGFNFSRRFNDSGVELASAAPSFNMFSDIVSDPGTGELRPGGVEALRGEKIEFKADRDLIVGAVWRGCLLKTSSPQKLLAFLRPGLSC